MSRFVCLALGLAALAAAPGCSSCMGGGNSCRRPSFMEFRSPCSQQAQPCHDLLHDRQRHDMLEPGWLQENQAPTPKPRTSPDADS